MSRATTIVCTGIALAMPRTSVRAQAELQGRVFAEAGHTLLANAEVSAPLLGLRTQTDSLGRYRLQNIPRGEHLIVTRAVGFRPDSSRTAFDGDEALISDVTLKVSVNALPTVAVREAGPPVTRGKMVDYEERKKLGVGHFIDRELLEKDRNRRLGEILSSNAPNVQILYGTGSKAWAASGRKQGSGKCAMCRATRGETLDPADAAAGAPLRCYMDVYLDGVVVYSSSALGSPLFNLNSMQPDDVEAIEVYTSASQVPARYNKTSGGCGVMLIWTRIGGR